MTLTPGDTIRQTLVHFGRPLVRCGVVDEVTADGTALVRFGPDRYRGHPYHAYILASQTVEVIQPASQPILLGAE